MSRCPCLPLRGTQERLKVNGDMKPRGSKVLSKKVIGPQDHYGRVLGVKAILGQSWKMYIFCCFMHFDRSGSSAFIRDYLDTPRAQTPVLVAQMHGLG